MSISLDARSPIAFFVLVAVAAVLFGAYTDGPNAKTDSINALYLTGGGWHDFERQKELVPSGLNEHLPSLDINWTIVHEGQGDPEHLLSVLKEENWAEDYDVIVHNHAFGRVEDAAFVEHAVEHHKGTPAVLIHAANHSWRYSEPADPWFEFAGLQSMRHEGARPLTIENVDPDHPIMESFPAQWETPVEDELYVVEKVWGDITPLARAYGEETDAYHPVVWTNELEGTRVFSTTLGHHNEMFEQPAFLELIAEGLLWAIEESQ
jgi:type 1 glutamine amidotransferase